MDGHRKQACLEEAQLQLGGLVGRIEQQGMKLFIPQRSNQINTNDCVCLHMGPLWIRELVPCWYEFHRVWRPLLLASKSTVPPSVSPVKVW